MCSSPTSVVIELDTSGYIENYTEILFTDDNAGMPCEDNLNEVSLPSSNSVKELGVVQLPVKVALDDDSGKAGVKYWPDKQAKACFVEEPKLLSDDQSKICLDKDLEVCPSKESNVSVDEQFKVDNSKYEKVVTKEIVNGVNGSECQDKKNKILELEELDHNVYETLNKNYERNSKEINDKIIKANDHLGKKFEITDTEYDYSIFKDNAEDNLNKNNESDSKDKNVRMFESDYCHNERLKTDNKAHEECVLNNTIKNVSKRVAENDCDCMCSPKVGKYSLQATSDEKRRKENEQVSEPNLNSKLESSEKCIWKGYICFKDFSIPTRGYCLQGNRDFAAKMMETMETMPIVLKDDRYIAKQKIWERFKDASRYTTVIGVNEGQMESEAIEDFERCFVNEGKCFYRVFSPIETPKVLYNVYIFKMDFKTKNFINQIKPNCKLIKANKSYFVMFLGHAWRHEALQYLQKFDFPRI